jgi:hypothetical protein
MQWQHKLSILALLLLSGCQNSDRQSMPRQAQPTVLGKSYTIPVGTLGIVSIAKATQSSYELNITFPDLFATASDRQKPEPIRLKANDTVVLTNSLQLFDSSGTAIKIPRVLPVKIDRWCQNDGGYHYRSVVNIVMSKNELRDRIHQVSELEKFVLFAVVGDLAAVPPLTTPIVATTGAGRNTTTSKLVMDGRQPPTKRLVSRILQRDNPLWAGCGDGAERPSLVLETASGQSNLRCCGP